MGLVHAVPNFLSHQHEFSLFGGSVASITVMAALVEFKFEDGDEYGWEPTSYINSSVGGTISWCCKGGALSRQ